MIYEIINIIENIIIIVNSLHINLGVYDFIF